MKVVEIELLKCRNDHSGIFRAKGNDCLLAKDNKTILTLFAAKKRGKNRKREGHFRLCPSLLTPSPQLPKTKSLESSL